MKRVVASWSGGKDCCLAFWRAVKEELSVGYLYTAISEEYGRVSFHGLKASFITLQAESMGVTLIQKRSNWENYEQCLLESLSELRHRGVEGVVFGDIALQEHRDWGERLCREVGMEAYYPLWKADQRQLLQEFIAQGFKAIVVAVNPKFFGPETLGRPIDEGWVKELDRLGNVTYCGEQGEYHTVVYDGPPFKRKIKITQGRKMQRNVSMSKNMSKRHWLDIPNYSFWRP